MTWLSHNEMWEAFGTRALFWAGTGSDFGEVKNTIGRIGAGDVHDWRPVRQKKTFRGRARGMHPRCDVSSDRILSAVWSKGGASTSRIVAPRVERDGEGCATVRSSI